MRVESPSFRHADAGFAHSDAMGAIRVSGENAAGGAAVATDPAAAGARRILIVQGDWEAGMSRLGQDLMDAGHHVGKVFLCAPDLIYRIRGISTHVFREHIDHFADWLRELVRTEDYDAFFLYNHYRPYNQIAWNLARELEIDCHVFELGLIRPNCVMVFCDRTVPIQAIPAAWRQVLAENEAPERPDTPPELCRVSTPAKLILFGANFLISRLTAPLFPHFVDQRRLNLWHHLKHGVIHLWRFFERGPDREYDALFGGEWSGKYYAVPLQVHSDTQITKCSNFKSIEQFIKQVVKSFARHAPPDTKLVLKVHPMDRGYKDYTDLIAGLNHQLGGNRLIYVDRVHLPTLLENAIGVVNINSSVGISGLIHHTPVIALGTAVYDLPELTFQGSLDEFWNEAAPPSRKRVDQFVSLLLASNQGRGTLSQRCFDVPNRCRIQWPPAFREKFFSSRSTSFSEGEIRGNADSGT